MDTVGVAALNRVAQAQSQQAPQQATPDSRALQRERKTAATEASLGISVHPFIARSLGLLLARQNDQPGQAPAKAFICGIIQQLVPFGPLDLLLG